MICYKVLRVDGDDLKSFSANTGYNSFPEEFIVVYKKDRISYPKVHGTTLFVFRDKRSARSFKENYMGNTVIWKCDGVDLKDVKVVARFEYISILWEYIKRGMSYKDCYSMEQLSVPNGACTASHIRLLEQV